MRKILVALCCLMMLCASLTAQFERPLFSDDDKEPPKIRVGALYGISNITGFDSTHFSFNHTYGLLAGYRTGRIDLTLNVIWNKNYQHLAALGDFTYFKGKDDAQVAFSGLHLGIDIDYRLMQQGQIIPKVGIGFGYMIWELSDPENDSSFTTTGQRGNIVDFGATEFFASAAVSADWYIKPHVAITPRLALDYLTGVGTDFSDEVNDLRGRLSPRLTLSVSYLFDFPRKRQAPITTVEQVRSVPRWPGNSEQPVIEYTVRQAVDNDSDGDGITDKNDNCPDTPAGAFTDKKGCPGDSDDDGVYDGLDDCPDTPPAAHGLIDIYGCPVDTDFDGVPDYRDGCPGPIGAVTDADGCPLDSDADGVYDGLDDCSDTPSGIEVDRRGCMDISFLDETLIINIDYQSGSFEVDERTRRRLVPLIDKLKILSYVKITIFGYTDNVGPAEANLELSQKRANRLRDWMVSQGIASNRINPIGRGEINFIASNDTAEGRAKNRRIEMMFKR